jgi:fanconi anemia group M protein
MEQKKFREESTLHRHPQHSTIMEYFSTCVSLYHALECLERHGLRVFVNYFDSDDGMEKYFVQKDRGIKAFLENLRAELGPNPFAINDATLLNGTVQEIAKDLDFGHPKYEILRKHLCQHFEVSCHKKTLFFS